MMARTTLIYAALLMLLGLAGYFGSGRDSATALIPAFFGVVFAGLGVLAMKEKLRRHAMHAAAALALLAFLATVKAWMKIPALMSENGVERPLAIVSQSIMALLSAVFVGLCVRSFIQARRTAAK